MWNKREVHASVILDDLPRELHLLVESADDIIAAVQHHALHSSFGFSESWNLLFSLCDILTVCSMVWIFFDQLSAVSIRFYYFVRAISMFNHPMLKGFRAAQFSNFRNEKSLVPYRLKEITVDIEPPSTYLFIFAIFFSLMSIKPMFMIKFT